MTLFPSVVVNGGTGSGRGVVAAGEAVGWLVVCEISLENAWEVFLGRPPVVCAMRTQTGQPAGSCAHLLAL